jgi:RNA polymerase sigma factor (sigma-70 family)
MEATIDDLTRRTTVSRAAAGDELAFARIVAAYHDDLARVAYVVCGDADLAQEAALAAWTIAWRKLGTVRDAERVRAWLVSVAANEAKRLAGSRGRRFVREVPIDAAFGSGGGDGGAADPARRVPAIDLANALTALSAADRTILALRYAAGLTSAEIGAAVGLSAPGVRARIARLLDRLRTELNDA